jgi:hypothetical protein
MVILKTYQFKETISTAKLTLTDTGLLTVFFVSWWWSRVVFRMQDYRKYTVPTGVCGNPIPTEVCGNLVLIVNFLEPFFRWQLYENFGAI